jgi:hypothetical protein
MRIYDGSPRQDFEEVLRSIGAFLDQRNLREVLLLEAPDGFIVQGLVTAGGATGTWSESLGQESKETLTFIDDDIARFMEEALARRGAAKPGEAAVEGNYEKAFRVLGRYFDEKRPHDVFFFEQSGAFVVRTLVATQAGKRHELAEFTREDIEALIARGPSLRNREPAKPAAPAAPAPAAPPR